MGKETSLWNFAKSILDHWVAWVGGSIVAIILQVVLPAFELSVSKWVPPLVLLIGLLWACYLAWKDKANKIKNLEERLRPKLRAQCGSNVLKSRVLTKMSNVPVSMLTGDINRTGYTEIETYYFRIVLETAGVSAVQNCRGCLTGIRKDGIAIHLPETLYLKFASGDDEKESTKTIRNGMPADLDVLAILKTGHVWVTTPQWHWPASLDRNAIFREIGIYTLKIVIGDDDTTSIEVELEFNWSGNWQTADLKLKKSKNLNKS